jgi:putative protease
MNSKDLNLIRSIDTILKSGAVDSIKIEGRTKAPYYVGVVTKAYREAVDDFYKGEFNPDKYEKEIFTTKNRGFTDGYLVKRVFEKYDTQNFETSLTEGDYQVSGVVNQDKKTFMCKYKTLPNDIIEIVLPYKEKIKECNNEIGEIYQQNNKWFLKLKKIVTITDKELKSVHSGNLNPIKLPCELPYLTFLRKLETNK